MRMRGRPGLTEFDRAREIVERYANGFVGPLTEAEWNAIQNMAARLWLINHGTDTNRVQLSPYMQALMRVGEFANN